MTTNTIKIHQRANQINGRQYPYGFVSWLRKVGLIMGNSPTYYEKLVPDGWLHYFNDGLSPILAVEVDLLEQG